MKTLLALIISLTTLSAFAGEITLMDRATWNFYPSSSYTQDFEINKELGRAWVSLKFNDGSEGASYDEQRVKVEGLSFNPTTSQIQLDVDGVQIICANVKINFFGTKIRPTGKCTFKQKNYSVKVDNGYEVETIQKLKITLNY